MIVGMNILNTSDVLFCKMYREDVWVITTAGQGIVLMKNDSECDQNILSTSSRHGNENDVLCRRIMCVHIQVLTRITAMPAAFLLLKWQVIYIYTRMKYLVRTCPPVGLLQTRKSRSPLMRNKRYERCSL